MIYLLTYIIREQINCELINFKDLSRPIKGSLVTNTQTLLTIENELYRSIDHRL